MKKLLYCAVMLLTGAPVWAWSQSPTDGRVEAGAYINSYFHLSYSWPKALQPYDAKSLLLGAQSPYGNEFLLFAARQGDEPYGIVMLAEKLNFPTPHSRPIRDSADFVDRLMRFKPEEHVTNLNRKHFTSPTGLVIDEVDYEQNGGYSSGVVTTVGQFLIVFKCNARTADELAVMTRSAASMQVQK